VELRTTHPQQAEVSVGDAVSIDCVTSSKLVMWIKEYGSSNNEVISISTRDNSSSKHTLTFRDVQHSDFATYSCQYQDELYGKFATIYSKSTVKELSKFITLPLYSIKYKLYS